MVVLGYIFLYPFLWLISILPLRVLYVISDFFYYIIYYLVGYRKKVVFQNLKKSFPEKSEEEIKTIAQKFYRHFTDLLFETIKLFTISEKELTRRINYKSTEIIDDLYNRGKHGIVVMGHYGNWEWLMGVSRATKHHAMSLYKPLANKFIDKMICKNRSRFGADLVPMKSALRAILKYKQENLLTLSCFIADQSPIRNEIQYWTKFLNQDTPVLLGIEKIAKLTNEPVLFYRILPVSRGYYEIEIIKLFEEVKDLKPYEITEAHTRVLEQTIRNCPEYWLWTHRRWKWSHMFKTQIIS
jgi:Kdo2-lipid IVA lauroyltransferase/acyltransferase